LGNRQAGGHNEQKGDKKGFFHEDLPPRAEVAA
jgi:hypothetical protein